MSCIAPMQNAIENWVRKISIVRNVYLYKQHKPQHRSMARLDSLLMKSANFSVSNSTIPGTKPQDSVSRPESCQANINLLRNSQHLLLTHHPSDTEKRFQTG